VANASRTEQLSVDLIVCAALEIADREGLDAVSMRRVGTELGCAAMSLYGYVESKDELLGHLVDHVLGTIPATDAHMPWQDAMVAFFTALHEALLAHPAVAQVVTLRPTLGPNTQRHGERMLEVLRAGGLSDRLAVEAFTALSCYAIGAAVYTASRDPGADDPVWIGLGSAPVDSESSLAPLRRHLAARTSREQFRSGLEHLVRGYAADTATHSSLS
jgi:AcrR family transcriptional regulator